MELTERVVNRFEKQLKIFNKKAKRDELKVLHYSADGHIEITNSLVAVRLKDVHKQEDSHPGYPALGRIFDSADFKGKSCKLDVKAVVNLLAPFKKEKQKSVDFEFAADAMTVLSCDPDAYSTRSGKWEGAVKIDDLFFVKADPTYMHDCFQFFKMLKVEEVEMFYTSNVRPMMFRFENLEYLVTPMRNFDWT